jgi:hypothetical protein
MVALPPVGESSQRFYAVKLSKILASYRGKISSEAYPSMITRIIKMPIAVMAMIVSARET